VPAKDALETFRADPLSSRLDDLGNPYLRLSSATIRDFGTRQLDGSIEPFVTDRTVWAVIYSNVPWAGAHQGPRVTGRSDVVAFIDASTGELINIESFPRAESPRPFSRR
jgi:hypothetical protein